MSVPVKTVKHDPDKVLIERPTLLQASPTDKSSAKISNKSSLWQLSGLSVSSKRDVNANTQNMCLQAVDAKIKLSNQVITDAQRHDSIKSRRVQKTR
jgi:hypothetical protein